MPLQIILQKNSSLRENDKKVSTASPKKALGAPCAPYDPDSALPYDWDSNTSKDETGRNPDISMRAQIKLEN